MPHADDPLGEHLDENCILTEYPRPQMRRNSYLNLNGRWEYAITDSDESPPRWDGTILVPFSPESALSGVGRSLQPGQTLWYRREVIVPQGFIPADGRLLLHFGAVDQEAAVYWNGRLLGRHMGGYNAFTLDATDALGPRNSLVVRVHDDTDASFQQPGESNEPARRDLVHAAERHLADGVDGGRAPALYREPAHRAAVDQSAVEVMVRCSQPLQCEATVDGRTVPFTSGEPARIPMPDFRAWSPEDPYLYDLSVTLGEDRVESYFGMRKMEVRADRGGVKRLFLNGEPYFQSGLLDQGYWPDGLYTAPSDEALIYDIQTAKAMGFNLLRKHIKVEPMRWYYHCDRLGMLVWQDAVSGGGEYNAWATNRKPTLMRATWNKYRDDTAKHFAALGADDSTYRRDWSRTCDAMVHMLAGHPSIVTWVLFNEGWGQFDACDAAERIHALDPTRPIDATSGWYDQRCGDFHSVHNYFRPLEIYPDKGPLRGYVAEYEKRHKRRRRAAHYAVLPVAQHGVRAFVISEFGGLAQLVADHAAVSRAYGYGEYDSIEDWRTAVRSVLDSAVMRIGNSNAEFGGLRVYAGFRRRRRAQRPHDLRSPPQQIRAMIRRD